MAGPRIPRKVFRGADACLSVAVPALPPLTGPPNASLAAPLALTFAAGGLYGWSGLIPALEATYGTDATQAGLVFSLSIGAFTTAVLVWPRLPHPSRPLVWLGAAGGAALALAAVAPSYGLFLLAFCAGFGTVSGAIYVACLARAAESRRPALATPALVAAFGLGGALFGPLWRALAAVGWGMSALWPLAMVMLAATVLAMTQPSGPSRTGLRAGAGAAGRPVQGRVAAALWLIFATGSFAGLMVLGLATQIAEAAGLAAAASGLVAGGVALANTTGRLWVAALATRIAPAGLPVVALVLVLCGLGLAGSGGAGGLIGGLLCIALGYGTMASAIPVLVASQAGPQGFARLYSVVFTGWGAAGLAAPLIAGAVFDRTGSFGPAIHLALAVSGLGLAVSLALLLGLRVRR